MIGELSAIGTAILWSFSSFIFTWVSIKIGSLQLSFWRLICAGILLGITIYFASIPFDLSYNQYFYLSMSGIIGLVLGDTFLFAAFKEIGPRFSMLIMSSNPGIAALMAYFVISEGISGLGIIGMVTTLIGIYIVIGFKNKDGNAKFKISRKGIFYGFLAALGQAVGLIFAKIAFMESDINGLAATQVRIISSIIVFLPAMLITRRFRNPIVLFGGKPKLIGMLGVGSVIGPYLGITLSYIAITNTKIGIAATLMSVVPIIMLPLSMLFYKEKLSLLSIAGAVIAVAGVAILFLR